MEIDVYKRWRRLKVLFGCFRTHYLWKSLLDLPIYLRLKKEWLKDPTPVTGREHMGIHPQFKSWVRQRADQVYWAGLGETGLDSLQIVLANWTLRFRRVRWDDQSFVVWDTKRASIRTGEEVFVFSSHNVDPGGSLAGVTLTPAVYQGNGVAVLPNGVMVERRSFWTRTPEWER